MSAVLAFGVGARCGVTVVKLIADEWVLAGRVEGGSRMLRGRRPWMRLWGISVSAWHQGRRQRGEHVRSNGGSYLLAVKQGERHLCIYAGKRRGTWPFCIASAGAFGRGLLWRLGKCGIPFCGKVTCGRPLEQRG